MVQVLKESKFLAIVLASSRVFAQVGFRRAMISDIATEAGVALGTVYRYASSKEELFELALREALGDPPEALWHGGSTKTRFEESLLEFVRDRLVGVEQFPLFRAAVAAQNPADPAAELEAIVGEIFDVMARLHVAIRIVDRSTADWPELAAIFAGEVRGPLVEQLAEYLARRSAGKHLAPFPDAAVAARYLVEGCATLAMHRHFTSGGAYTDDATARATAIHFLVAGFQPTTRTPKGRSR